MPSVPNVFKPILEYFWDNYCLQWHGHALTQVQPMTLEVQRIWDQLESQQMRVHGVLTNDNGCHIIKFEKDLGDS
jgi:hypothetical protein